MSNSTRDRSVQPPTGESEPARKRGPLGRLGRLLYWVLPVAILALILARIDLGVLIETVRDSRPVLYLLGICLFPTTLLIGSIRWRLLIRQYLGRTEGLGYLLRHYCIGLSVSIFLPGQIGMDIYRIAIAGRRFRRYVPNIAVVLEEKMLSAVVCVGLVLGLTPWIDVDGNSSVLASILDVAYALAIGLGSTVAILFLVTRLAAARRLAGLVSRRLKRAIVSILQRVGVDTARVGPLPPIDEIFGPLSRPRELLPVALLSMASFVALGLANQLFLAALNYDLPFAVSLFVVSVTFFAVSIPISFAGLGVREGAFILVLGLFDVPAESALVVSFFSLSGMLLNYAIGGAAILANRRDAVALASKTQ